MSACQASLVFGSSSPPPPPPPAADRDGGGGEDEDDYDFDAFIHRQTSTIPVTNKHHKLLQLQPAADSDAAADTDDRRPPIVFGRRPPLDCGLHYRLKVTMSSSTLTPTLSPSPMTETLAQALSLRCSDPLSLLRANADSDIETVLAALLTYHSFPHDTLDHHHPLTSALHQANSRQPLDRTPHDKLIMGFYHSRVAQWEEAYRGLYYQWKHGLVPYFVYQCRDYTVLFAHTHTHAEDSSDGGGGGGAVRAVISRSTHSLRQSLQQSNVDFTQPHYIPSHTGTSSSNGGGGVLSASELSTIQRKKPLSSIKFTNVIDPRIIDDTLASMLVITGHHHCHLLFDYLLNLDRSGRATIGSVEDVPLLMAHSPFKHATLSHYTLAQSTDRMLELSGGAKPILPLTQLAACQLFASLVDSSDDGSVDVRSDWNDSHYQSNGAHCNHFNTVDNLWIGALTHSDSDGSSDVGYALMADNAAARSAMLPSTSAVKGGHTQRQRPASLLRLRYQSRQWRASIGLQ